jgi:hypothetical protein
MEDNVRDAQETEKGTGCTGAEAETDEERKFRRMVFHGWIIVFAIAALFVAYGFLAFFIIGDKGPPDWDYGSIRDVPAQSVYSTYPYSEHAGAPEPQHVNRPPADATIDRAETHAPPKPEIGDRIR